MTRKDVYQMAIQCVPPAWVAPLGLSQLERFAALVAAAEREKVAQWMIQRSYATGHGDTTEDLLSELEWQVAERERKAILKQADSLGWVSVEAIRARGET